MGRRLLPRSTLPTLALLGVAGVTAVWWGFALWPSSADTPEWVIRTRYVCFGDRGDGLPAPAGWLLLIGQPASMLGFLVVVWGGELRRSLGSVLAGRLGRVTISAVALLLVVGAVLAAVRVSTAQPAPTRIADSAPPIQRLATQAPPLVLRDQHGKVIDLTRLRGQPVVIAFAFAHCETICPLIVRDVNAALDRLRDRRVVALIVTVDPWRDTPERLPHIARQWQLGDEAHVLSGTVAEVVAVLAAWRIGIGRNPRTGDVTHAGAVYLVAPDGHLAYALPASSEALAIHIREVASR